MPSVRKSPNLSAKRRLLFSVILALLPVALIILMELMLRVVGYGQRYRLFVPAPDERFAEYLQPNPDIGQKYFDRFGYSPPSNDMFKQEKPDNGYRIFVLGSSTVAGFPYDQNLMFSRILEDRLQTLYPDRAIEVVNTAITAINSHSLVDFTRMVLREEPDALLIYAGHNEFYGALGVGSTERISHSHALTQLHLSLLDFRLYQMVRDLIGLLRPGPADDISGTLMARIAESRDIAYQSPQYHAGISQYERNLRDMLRMARRAGVQVFLSEVVSNVRDLPPFSSPPSGGHPGALEVFRQAQAYEAQGNIARARELYYLAKDLDGVRFRASQSINGAIRALASAYGAHLVPMVAQFEAHSPNGLIGNNLMTEHVHPNILGFFLMADAFYTAIAQSGAIGPFYAPFHRCMFYHKRNWGYTELDSLIGHHRVAGLMLSWPFRPLYDPIDYRLIYQPTHFVDSIAFDVMRGVGSALDAHRLVGHYHLARQNPYRAYREFKAAITIAPFATDDFLLAINSLLSLNDHPRAAALAERMVELEETFQGHYYMGQFQVLRGNYQAALDAYARAEALAASPADRHKLMGSQALALYFDGQLQRAQEVVRRIQQADPRFQLVIPQFKRHIAAHVPNYIAQEVMRGFELYRANRFAEALPILLGTLSIRETPMANRTVGEILLRVNNPDAYIYLERALPEFRNDFGFLNHLFLSLVEANQKARAEYVLAEMQRVNPSHGGLARHRETLRAMD